MLKTPVNQKLKQYQYLSDKLDHIEKAINDLEIARESLSGIVQTLSLHDDNESMTAFKEFHQSHGKARRVLLSLHDGLLQEMKSLCK